MPIRLACGTAWERTAQQRLEAFQTKTAAKSNADDMVLTPETAELWCAAVEAVELACNDGAGAGAVLDSGYDLAKVWDEAGGRRHEVLEPPARKRAKRTKHASRAKRVKWADEKGGELASFTLIPTKEQNKADQKLEREERERLGQAPTPPTTKRARSQSFHDAIPMACPHYEYVPGEHDRSIDVVSHAVDSIYDKAWGMISATTDVGLCGFE